MCDKAHCKHGTTMKQTIYSTIYGRWLLLACWFWIDSLSVVACLYMHYLLCKLPDTGLQTSIFWCRSSNLCFVGVVLNKVLFGIVLISISCLHCLPDIDQAHVPDRMVSCKIDIALLPSGLL